MTLGHTQVRSYQRLWKRHCEDWTKQQDLQWHNISGLSVDFCQRHYEAQHQLSINCNNTWDIWLCFFANISKTNPVHSFFTMKSKHNKLEKKIFFQLVQWIVFFLFVLFLLTIAMNIKGCWHTELDSMTDFVHCTSFLKVKQMSGKDQT